MPAPGRGVAVLQVAQVSTVSDGAATVTLGDETYTLPYVQTPTVDDDVWVLFDGRTGLILGAVQT